MQDIKSLYIQGEPIETNVGLIHFVKVKDYHKLMYYVPYLNLQKFEIINHFKQTDIKDVKDFADELDKMSFIEIIKNTKTILELYEEFSNLFNIVFEDEGILDLIETDEEFEYIRSLIRDMNCIEKEEKNPNPEIEYFNQLKKLYNKNKNSNVSFESIYTSVWLELKNKPCDMTIYEFYAIFNRLIQFKNYDTAILYNSVSGEVKIEPWYTHVDMFKKPEVTDLDEFSKNAISILQ